MAEGGTLPDSAMIGEGGGTAQHIAAMGGGDGSGYKSDVFVAVPASDGSIGAWSSTVDLPTTSYRGAATMIGSAMYLLPGKVAT
jgi:hypothetical protein